MVLWELTLATAYVLGLKRTYRIVLRAQRRFISRRLPRFRNFVYRRTRDIFSVAINVHQGIQQRDISIGKSLGNRMLRLLDRMRPQANIRGESARDVLPRRPDVPAIGSGRKNDSGGSSDNARPMHTGSKPGASSSVDHVDRHYSVGLSRASVRSRITDSLGRLKVKPAGRSLPVLALGLWWQPVRKHMETMLLRTPVEWPRLSTWRQPLAANVSTGLPYGHHSVNHAGSLFREDIGRLIRGTVQVSRLDISQLVAPQSSGASLLRREYFSKVLAGGLPAGAAFVLSSPQQ